MNALELETLFAEMGLPSILAGKPRLSKATLTAAATRERDIRRRLLRFLARDAWEPAAEMVAIDYAELLTQLSAGKLSPAQVNAVFAVVPDKEDAQEICNMADAVIGWANGLLPRGDADPVTGEVIDEPPKVALLDFRRLWGVAIDPMAVLDDLADGSLTDDEIGVLGQFYPETQKTILSLKQEAVATMVARRGKSWTPTSDKAALLGTLAGTPTINPALAATMQQIYAAQEMAEMQAAPPPPKRAPSGGGGADQTEGTPGQQSAAG